MTCRTKALVITNPNNPTGSLYPREVLQELFDIAREHNLIIFSGEIYDRIVMDGLDGKFALDLLHEKRLLVVHGGGFNWKTPDRFRVVYLPRIKAMCDLGDFLSRYRQAEAARTGVS